MATCRACAVMFSDGVSGEDLVPIFSKLEDEFIASLIVECCAVQVFEDDGLPTQICRPCLSDLKQTNAFVRKVRSADRKLRKALSGELSDVEKNDSQKEDFGLSAGDAPLWHAVSVDQLKQENDPVDQLKAETEDNGQANNSVTDGSQSNVESDTEEYSKQITKTNRIFEPRSKTPSTNSDSGEEPTKKRRRQRRPRKLEHIVGKGDGDSEDDSIPENRLAEMYKTIQVDPHGHVCCACLKVFTDRAELIQHGQSSHTKKKYINESKTNICDVCFRRYSKPGPLEAHKQGFIGLDVVYECCRCLTRVIAMNRRQHVRTHLKQFEGPLKDDDRRQAKREQLCCAKDCSARFPSEELLLEHGKQVHIGTKVDTDDPQRRYECPVCFKRFNKRDALTRHRHRMYRATHQCAVCGKEFRNRYEMLVHERNHENVKLYSCELCGKRFNSKEAVRVHMLVHSDSKPFACTVCGWRFRRKCNLNKHASKHSEDTPFECSICQKTFKGKYHLQYHMRIHTGQKPFPCRYCDKSFACHANRKRHETSHTGIKPYKCTYCDKTFIRKRFQIEHESTHTGIKPYRCEMCNRSFSQKTSLKKHLEIHPLAPENQLALAQPSPMPAESPMSPPISLPPPSSQLPQQQQQQVEMGPPPAGQLHPNLMTAAMISAMQQGSGGPYQQPM